MTTDIRIKNVCPVIGVISSGKSSILNSLFNMDYLETSSKITTKIVTIIRYNTSVTNPKFYKVNLKKDANNNYIFYKVNDSEIIGRDNIREKIKNKNKELNEQKEINYEKIFYLLEIGQVKFIDTEFLKNYDLVDVPGLSESTKNKENNQQEIVSKNNYDLTTEEELKNKNVEKEINYLTQIFGIFKNKMNNGIFIFSVDKYPLSENYRIVYTLQKVLNKPLENYLLLLNKMDLSEDIEKDMEQLTGHFVKEFPNGIFNVTRNTIVPCSSFQLENEIKMDKEFANYIYSRYINYIMETKKASNHNFIEFILRDLERCVPKKKEQEIEIEEFQRRIKSIVNEPNLKKITDIVKKIHLQHDTNEMALLLNENDFEIQNIENKLNNLVTIGEGDDIDVDILKQEGVIMILYLYYLYENKKIKIEQSSITKTIKNYFTIQNMNRKFNYREIESELNELENRDTINKKADDLIKEFENLEKSYRDCGLYSNQMDNFTNSLNPIKNILKTSKYFYIPFLGVMNAGKSTIINNLIGYDLLPTGGNECTKKGILIFNWEKDFPIIRKAEFITENDVSYFKIANTVYAEGDKNVRKILEGLNENFTDNEKDYFYVINVKLQFLDNFKDFNLKLAKEKICFVDLPGYGTKNKFEIKDIYSKFIKSCKLFLIITRDTFKEKTPRINIMELLSKTSDHQNISIGALAKKILFIYNYTNEISDDSLQTLRNELNDIFEESKDDINLISFEGQKYHHYLTNKLLFSSPENVFKNIRNQFDIESEKFRNGYSVVRTFKNNFESYLLDHLKNELNKFFHKNLNQIEQIIDKEISESIDRIILEKKYKFKEEDLNSIKKIITYYKKNIENSDLLSNSNYFNFKQELKNVIIISRIYADSDIRNLINQKLANLDKIFRIIEDEEYKINQSKLLELKDNKNKILEKALENKNESKESVPKKFEQSINEINSVLENIKKDIDKNLKSKNWKEIQQEFETTFNGIVKEKKKEIKDSIISLSSEITVLYEKEIRLINDLRKNPDNNYNIDELTIYISNNLEERNDFEKAIDNIVNDIILDSKQATYWKNRTGFFDFLKEKIFDKPYLIKTIDFIISNSEKKLNTFKKRISEIISKYLEEKLLEINIEDNNITNYLAQQKEDNKKKNEDWGKVCDEYNAVKKKVNNILVESDFCENSQAPQNQMNTATPTGK